MHDDKKTPEQKRENLRQKELKKNPTRSMNDAFNRAKIGNLADLAGSLGWKGMGILIIVIIIGIIFVSIYFK